MMGRWVFATGVVFMFGCADGGVVVPSAEYEVCLEGEQMPCEPGSPNGAMFLCIDGTWDESMCPGGVPMGGSGG